MRKREHLDQAATALLAFQRGQDTPEAEVGALLWAEMFQRVRDLTGG